MASLTLEEERRRNFLNKLASSLINISALIISTVITLLSCEKNQKTIVWSLSGFAFIIVFVFECLKIIFYTYNYCVTKLNKLNDLIKDLQQMKFEIENMIKTDNTIALTKLEKEINELIYFFNKTSNLNLTNIRFKLIEREMTGLRIHKTISFNVTNQRLNSFSLFNDNNDIFLIKKAQTSIKKKNKKQ